MEDVDTRFYDFMARLGEIEMTPDAERTPHALQAARDAVDASVKSLEEADARRRTEVICAAART